MAKKVKTPEEVKAAMEKKVAKRTLFFGTFRKALAFFLAIAFTFAMVQIAFTSKTGGVVASSGTSSSDNGGSGNSGTGTGDDGYVDLGGNTTDDNGSGDTNSADNNGSGDAANNNGSGSGSASSTEMSKAEGAEVLNKATAEAAKAGYDWSRKCYYTDDGALSVKTSNGKDATDTLDGIIHIVDKNASLGSVVGGFLDITGKDDAKTAKKAKGSNVAPDEMKKDKFLLKAMTLTEGDLSQFVKQGDTYKYQVNSCNNPQKDNSNALHHATNDFTTKDEVAQQVADALGKFSSRVTINSAEIQYNSIVIVAEIKDGKLQSLSLSYIMDVKSLNLTAAVAKIVGTGKAKVEANYTNFVY